MKHSLVRTIGTLVLALSLAGVAQAQQTRCEMKALEGSWAYTEGGTVSLQGTATATSAVGRYAFDRLGTFTGIQWTSTAGFAVAYDTKDGTYTVNDDCTITMTVKGYRNGVWIRDSKWQIVLADNGKDMRGISLSLKAWLAGNWVDLSPVLTMTGTWVGGSFETR